MKFMTPGEAETKRQKAVEFLHRIGNDDLAEEFEDMSPAGLRGTQRRAVDGEPGRKENYAKNEIES
jgi:hypothetical protein